MYSSYPESYFQKLNDYLKWQTSRLRSLESKVESLSKELESLKKQRGLTIERIEYKFDQLKVEKLDGTLNVGISPAGLGEQSVQDMEVGGETIRTNEARSESFARIQQRVTDYLRQSTPAELVQLEEKYQVKLDENATETIIGDLEGQIGQRIDYYLKYGIDPNVVILTTEQEQGITDKVIRDIRLGLDQYFLKRKTEGGTPNESASGE
ncbi:spore germination protein GerPC [Paenibacillus sp. MZ04-78.2]|uniref:spore germination protein GerPC n=1 Tax=Paenibacillus sp. MZ04-78.2 TaxID=2962034 RepID=UPI0020B70EC1|nr:spore germination protein GerPC [Paenibacillus sp. MZ04-78.2]MCP3771880.1 spore germination protein GerPC [Paenibacillus sp. MZ04-78.2]